MTPALRLSDTICAGTPPNQASARPCEPIQSGSVCVQVASANVWFDAPSTATKSWAWRTVPVVASITGSVAPA